MSLIIMVLIILLIAGMFAALVASSVVRAYGWIAGLAVATLMLSGCASQKEFYETQQFLIKEAMSLKAKSVDLDIAREKTRTAAMTAITGKLDAGGAAALGVAMALGDVRGGAQPDHASELLKLVALQRPPEAWDDKMLKWASILVPAALQGVKIYADKDLGIATINGNVKIQEAIAAMVTQINRDTAAGVGANRQASGPTYQITVNDSQGVGIMDGTGSYQGPLSIACSGASGPAGAAGAGAAGSIAGGGAPGGAGGQSGTTPVTCAVTR